MKGMRKNIARRTDHPATTVCNAKTKDGGHCQRPAGEGTSHPGTGRCSRHRGNCGAPIAHGRYSTLAPKHIRKRVEELSADPTLMDLTSEVALVTCMIEEELRLIKDEAGEQAEAWLQARTLYEGVVNNVGNQAVAMKNMTELGKLLRGEHEIVTRWRRIDEMIGRKANLVQVHRQQLRDANLTLSVHEVVIFTMRVASVLSEELAGLVSQDVLKRIGQRIEAFLA